MSQLDDKPFDVHKKWGKHSGFDLRFVFKRVDEPYPAEIVRTDLTKKTIFMKLYKFNALIPANRILYKYHRSNPHNKRLSEPQEM